MHKKEKKIKWKDCKLSSDYILSFIIDNKEVNIRIGEEKRPGFVRKFYILTEGDTSFEIRLDVDGKYKINKLQSILNNIK